MYFPWSKLILHTNKVLQYNVPSWIINIAMKSSLKWEGERELITWVTSAEVTHTITTVMSISNPPLYLQPIFIYICTQRYLTKESDRAWNIHSNEVGFVTNEKCDRVKGYKYCDQELYLYSHLTHKRLCCSLARYLFKAANWGKEWLKKLANCYNLNL